MVSPAPSTNVAVAERRLLEALGGFRAAVESDPEKRTAGLFDLGTGLIGAAQSLLDRDEDDIALVLVRFAELIAAVAHERAEIAQ